MDANNLYWVLGAVGALASIIAILILTMPASWQRKASIWAAIVIGVITILLVLTRRSETIADVTVSHEPGTFAIADFLEFLSRGPFKVTMEPRTLDELNRRRIKIIANDLNKVSLQYVLDRVLTPQLPGPEQWTYEVVGKTVVIKRR